MDNANISYLQLKKHDLYCQYKKIDQCAYYEGINKDSVAADCLVTMNHIKRERERERSPDIFLYFM